MAEDYQGKAVEVLKERGELTPDFKHLKFFKRLPVFVYGPYQRTGASSHLLRDSPYLGFGHTLTKAFCLYIGQYGSPVVFPKKPDDTDTYHVKGEIRAVSPETLHVLDRWHENGNKYQRTLVRVSLEDVTLPNSKRFRGMSFIKAFMYVGIPEFWKAQELRKQYSTTISNSPEMKHMEFQYAPTSMRRVSSIHKGITDRMSQAPFDVEENESFNFMDM